MSRALALLVFVAAADLWLAHHFNIGLRDPGALAALVGAAAAAAGVVGKLLSDNDRTDVGGRLVATGRFFLTTPVLVVLYLVGATFALTLSSVRIISEGPDTAGAVRLIALDDTSVARAGTIAPGGLVRFRLPTTPFGRAVRIEAAGFVPSSFSLFPLRGLTVRLGRDLPPSPGVLLRPSMNALAQLADGGELRVWTLVAGDTVPLGRAAVRATAFLVGTPMTIPAALVDDWKLELAAISDERVRAQVLLAWKRYQPVLEPSSFGPGTRLRAVVYTRAKVPVAAADVVVGWDRLIDAPLVDRPRRARAAPSTPPAAPPGL